VNWQIVVHTPQRYIESFIYADLSPGNSQNQCQTIHYKALIMSYYLCFLLKALLCFRFYAVTFTDSQIHVIK